MKRTVRLVTVSGVALLLCMVMLVSSAFAGPPKKTLAEKFDYGSSLGANEEVSAKELLEMLLGKPISEAEGIYLNTLSGVSFRYSNFVPESNISTMYDRECGKLAVEVKPQRYTAGNGLVVEWIPTQATIDGVSLGLVANGEHYDCTFENVLHTGDFQMTVDFSWNVLFPDDAVEELLNLAYTAGDAALAEILAFETQLADYHAKMDAYGKYMVYVKEKQEYDDYMVLYRQYEKDFADYLAYEDAYKEYLAKKDLYEKWKAYWAYDEYQTVYLPMLKTYTAYKNKVALVEEKLRVMENLFITDSNGWQLYGGLMGSLVAEVVKEENKDLLVNKGGCNEEDVDNAGESAVVLRELMGNYSKLRNAKYASAHDKTAALYAFYATHYEELTVHFSQLCRSLNSLCGNTFLIIKLDEEGKLAHFRQFIGQLYVTATCLDDNVKRDPNWTVNKKKLEVVVEACNIVPDNISAKPKEGEMPAEEVLPVTSVAPVPPAEKPSGDMIKVEPTPPMPVVTKPTEPDHVPNPDDGVVPPYAEHPGDEPQAKPMDERLRALALEIRAGDLKRRELSVAAKAFSYQTQVTRLVSIDNRKLISFYARDRKTLLLQQTVEYGAPFTAYGIDTYLAPDAQYIYTFDYWALPDGTRAEFVAYSDMTVIASYIEKLRSYSVTWVLNDEIRTSRLNYGDMPVCPFDVNPTPETGYRYEFSGWDAEIAPVTGDVTYTATMKKIPLMYTITWDLGDRIETTEVPFGEYPSYGSTPVRDADTYVYRFTGWDVSPIRVNGEATYVAQYSKTPLAIATDKTPYDVKHTATELVVECTRNMADIQEAARYAWENNKDLTVSWEAFSITIKHDILSKFIQSDCRRVGILSRSISDLGADQIEFACFGVFGNPVQIGLPFVLKPGTAEAGAQSCVWVNGEYVTIGEEGILLTDSAKLQISPLRSITATANDNCNLSKIPASAQVGTLINLKISCAFGYEVTHARVLTADGVEVPVQNLSFYMPNSDVSVTLTVSEMIYTVIFRNEGQEIMKNTYRLGEEIVLPATPTKASDDQYDYTFEKWSNDVTIAMGDERTIVVDAVFTAAPKTVGDPYNSGNNNNVMLTVIIPIVGGTLLVVITGIVVLVKVRKKRKLRAQNKNQSELVDSAEEETES